MAVLLFDAALWAVAALIVYKVLDRLIRTPFIGRYNDRYIVVTGCDTGFGHAICKRLDGLGCHVYAACLTEKGEEELTKTCSKRLKSFHMNVADEKSVRKGYKFVSEQLPSGKGLWGLLNNAGVPGLVGPAEWLTKANYQQVLDVNLLGLIDTTTTFLPLIKRGHGRVVNTASMLGRTTLMGSTPYGVSKYGVESFSDSLRRQLRPNKISVHIIEPGFFRTSMSDPVRIERTIRQAWDQCTPEIQREYGKEYLEGSIAVVIRAMVQGLVSDKVELVHNAYLHALLGTFPRARYVLGLDARLVLLPIQMLPEWMSDYLHDLMSYGRPLPAACK